MNVRKLKSVHLTNYYHKTSGGISTVYNRLLKEANKHQRKVRLIVPGERNNQEEFGEYGRIYYVKATRSPIFDRRYRILLPWQYLPGDSAIRQILRKEMPDIVEIADKYTLSYLAGLIKKGQFKKLGRPLLVHLSCERMDDNFRAFLSGSKLFLWIAKKIMGNFVAPMFDYHLANSVYTAREILDSVPVQKNGAGLKPKQNYAWRFFKSTTKDFAERVAISNCGVDNKTFNVQRKNKQTRQRILEELGFPENTTLLLYVGRISPEKNIQLLSTVFRSLVGYHNYEIPKRKYRLLIVGDGPKAVWLKKKLQKHAPGKFKFLGHLNDVEKLADLYANADIFIHPNPREPFGIAPLEAMASGTPVIVPNAGGVLSYANDENAWVFDADHESFFAGIRDILNHPEKRSEKVKKALETAENFSWEKSITSQFRLYDELFEEFSGRREFLPPVENHPPKNEMLEIVGDKALNAFPKKSL